MGVARELLFPVSRSQGANWMDDENILDCDDGSSTHAARLAECESCVAQCLCAYQAAREAYEFEPWAAAEKELCRWLNRLLDRRVPDTKGDLIPDGLIATEISNVGPNEFRVCGRVYCLPNGTEPFAATFQVDPDGSQLTSYWLRFGNNSESDDVKREQFIHKAPTDAAHWDFEFHGT